MKIKYLASVENCIRSSKVMRFIFYNVPLAETLLTFLHLYLSFLWSLLIIDLVCLKCLATDYWLTDNKSLNDGKKNVKLE